MPPNCDHVVTLVHGTFARGAAWCHPTARLCSAIASALKGTVQFRTFQWSGKNTNQARLAAADELASFLEEGLSAYPKSQHVIVAHSHGGNVALYALRQLARPEISLVALATPFIEATPRSIRGHLDMIGKVLPYVIGWLLLNFLYLCTSVGIKAAAAGFGPLVVGSCFGLALVVFAFGLWFFEPMSFRIVSGWERLSGG